MTTFPISSMPLIRWERLGIGKRISGKRAHFILEEIKAQGNQIYSHKDQRLRRGGFVRSCLYKIIAMYRHKFALTPDLYLIK